MPKPKAKSLFSFAENIYDMGKKIIEESLSELNETHDEIPKSKDSTVLETSEPDIHETATKNMSLPHCHSMTSIIDPDITSNPTLFSQFDQNVDISEITNAPNSTPVDAVSTTSLDMYQSLKSTNECLTAVETYLKDIPRHMKIISSGNGGENTTVSEMCTAHAFISELNFYADECTRAMMVSKSRERGGKAENAEKLKIQADADLKYREKVDGAMNQLMEVNKNLESKYISVNEKYSEAVGSLQKCKMQMDRLLSEANESRATKSALTKQLAVKEKEIDEMRERMKSLETIGETAKLQEDATCDLNRLKSHLVEIEEEYTVRIKRLEENKKLLESQLQNMSLDVNRTKVTLQEVRANHDKHSKVFNEQMGKLNEERDKGTAQIIELLKTIDEQKNAMETLEYSLNDGEMMHESKMQMLVEKFEKERIELVVSMEVEEKRRLEEMRERLAKRHQDEIGGLREDLKRVEEELKKAVEGKEERKEDGLKGDGGVERILLQNLVLAYQKVNLEHKPYVWRVVCNVVGVEPIEQSPVRGVLGSTLAWIPGLNRLFAERAPIAGGPSLAELFVDFLESESKKCADPYVPPISTEELKNLISRHQAKNQIS